MPFDVPFVAATKDVAGEGWGGVNKVSIESHQVRDRGFTQEREFPPHMADARKW